jgi:hypothetical protein
VFPFSEERCLACNPVETYENILDNFCRADFGEYCNRLIYIMNRWIFCMPLIYVVFPGYRCLSRECDGTTYAWKLCYIYPHVVGKDFINKFMTKELLLKMRSDDDDDDSNNNYRAQAVSCRLPTVMARVRSQVSSCGICGDQCGTGAGFLRILRFPLPVLIPPTAPYSVFILWSTRYSPDTDRIIN